MITKLRSDVGPIVVKRDEIVKRGQIGLGWVNRGEPTMARAVVGSAVPVSRAGTTVVREGPDPPRRERGFQRSPR
jgi:hypothetical protein